MSSPQKTLSSGDDKTPTGDRKKNIGTSGGKTLPRSPTPPKQRGNRSRSRARTHRRGRSGDARDREVVVERIVEKSSVIQYPMLTRTNYHEWSLVMTVNFQAQELWEAIDPDDCDEREDRALAALLRSVPNDMWSTLARKRTMWEAWEAVKTIRVGVQRVRDSNAKKLRREFADIEFKNGESVDEFSLRITALADNLRTLGDDVRESEVVKKLLQVVPEYLEQDAVTCEMILELNATSVEEVTSRLRVFERRRNKTKPSTESIGKLLLTEDEWRARDKATRKQSGSSRSSSSGGKGKHCGKPQGRGGGSSASGGGSSDSRQGSNVGRPATRGDICKSCGKRGHWAKDCRSRPRKEQAHMAQDDEEVLMYIEASVDLHSAYHFVPHLAAPTDAGDLNLATAPPTCPPAAAAIRSAVSPAREAQGAPL
jgi:uncharacterized membrane protein YgcG